MLLIKNRRFIMGKILPIQIILLGLFSGSAMAMDSTEDHEVPQPPICDVVLGSDHTDATDVNCIEVGDKKVKEEKNRQKTVR